MADSGRPKPPVGIPSWQRAQQPLNNSNNAPGTHESNTREVDASSAVAEKTRHASDTGKAASATGGSKAVAERESDASKAAPSTDGSDVAAKQEFDASKATPSTDGSDVAAEQEFEASATVIDQVRKFLEDPKVKDAPVEKKRAFLSSKGVRPEIIHEVLEMSAPATTLSPAEFANQRPVPSARQPQMRREDVPPIVTYPEFLVQPQKPPPLVTIDRLMTTAYLAGGAAATIYGLSKYVIGPMSESLAMARHEFADHASSRIDTFNEKLSAIVSAGPAKSHPSTKPDVGDDLDNESVASDPTELFHRDFGTQTSPLPSPLESSTPPADSDLQATATALDSQADRLKILQSHVSEILQGSADNGATNESVQDSVEELRRYLDTLVYSPSAYQYLPGDTVFTPPGTPGGAKKKEDAAQALKAEIRGVKGVLLSAKRFPSAKAGA
ncbi:hypothetical protein MBLNU459_g8074t1 [Dothideomycetes sp. NU459]